MQEAKIQKWEYMVVGQYWDTEKKCLFWADNEADGRSLKERFDALGQSGWEAVSAFTTGAAGLQLNYLFKRPIE
jgi:hypothetical protein